jgi:predicted secreted Zn-dependent protease
MVSVKKRKPRYSDKSAGQPELIPIFERLKEILRKYEKDHLKLACQKDGQYPDSKGFCRR